MFTDMKVGMKIIAGFLLVTAITVLTGVVGYMGMGSIMNSMKEITGNRLPSVQSLLIISEAQQSVLVGERGLLNRSFMDPKIRTAQYAYIDKAMKRAEDAWKVYEPLPQTKEEEQVWKGLVPQWQLWKKEHQRVVDLSREKDRLIAAGIAMDDPKIVAMDRGVMEASLSARRSFISVNESLTRLTGMNEKYALDESIKSDVVERRAKLILIGTILLSTLLSLALGVFIARMISGPVQTLAIEVEKIARGDLSVTIHHESRDEIGQLADSFRKMASSLRELIGKVILSAETVSAAAAQLSGASEQIASGAEELASQAETLATASEEMAVTTMEIAKNCCMAAEESQNANNTALSGAEVVDSAITTMHQIAGRVKESAITMEGLSSRSNQIGQIVGTIEDIADQTNLLGFERGH